MTLQRATILFLGSSTLLFAACGPAKPDSPPTEVRVVKVEKAPDDPGAPAWHDVPAYQAHLILQDLVEPRLLQPSTTTLAVQALSDRTHLAFRLAWADDSEDAMPGPARFSDACAVQLPSRLQADVPAPQMGEAGRPVEILYWSAVQQTRADGGLTRIQDLYPNATVDHYPFEALPVQGDETAHTRMAARYAPARASGNQVAQKAKEPVQALRAEGPGTLAPADFGPVCGQGDRTTTGWSVVLVRPMPSYLLDHQAAQVAFAVWDGGNGEVGSRKMRTGWIPLAMEK